MNEYCMNMIHDMLGNWFFRCFEPYHSDEWFRICDQAATETPPAKRPSLFTLHEVIGAMWILDFLDLSTPASLVRGWNSSCWGTISRFIFWSCISQCGHQSSAEPINFFYKKNCGFCQGLVVISWLFKHVFWRGLLHQ